MPSFPLFSGGSGGSVLSVGISLPIEFNVTGSPVSTSGTFDVTLATQAANTVWAGPTAGAADVPAFRGLVAADIPSLSGIYQPLNANLTSIGALTTDAFGLGLLTKVDAAAVRSYIGAGSSGFTGAFADLSGIPTTLAGYGITDAQPLDLDLTAIAALTTTPFGRSLLTQADAATTRATIGAGTSSFNGTFAALTGIPTTLGGYGIVDGQPLDSDLTAIAALTTAAFGRSLLTEASAASARTTLGAGTSNFDGAFASLTSKPTTLAGYGITDGQILDGDLTAIAALATTTFGRSLLTQADAAAARATIGAGTSSFSGAFSGLTGIPTTLSGYGIVDAQPLDADLTAIAALTTTSFGRSVLIQADAAAVRTLIGAGSSSFSGAFSALSGIPTTIAGYGLVDAQPLDSDLTAIAALSTLAFGRSLLTAVDAAAARALTGAGTSNFAGTFAALTGKPTTIVGYGITDALASGPVTGSGLTMATARILGRTTASTGAIEELTAGTSLSLTAGSLDAIQDIRVSATPTFVGLNLVVGPAVSQQTFLTMVGSSVAGYGPRINFMEGALNKSYIGTARGIIGGSSTSSDLVLYSVGDAIQFYTGGASRVTIDASGGIKFSTYGAGILKSDASGNITSVAATTTSGLTMSTARILGRTTALTGAIEELTAGTSLSLAAGSLNTIQGIRTTDTPGFAGLALSNATDCALTVNAGASPYVQFRASGVAMFTTGYSVAGFAGYSIYDSVVGTQRLTVAASSGLTTLSGQLTANKAASSGVFSVLMSSTSPRQAMQLTSGSVDQKVWDVDAAGNGTLNYRVLNDADNAATNYLQVNRAGLAISSIIFGAGLTTPNPAGGTAAPWKLGGYSAGLARIEIAGTGYDLAAAGQDLRTTAAPTFGALTLNGNLTAVTGELRLDNGRGLYIKNAAGVYRQIFQLYTDNNFYFTNQDGTISFRTGASVLTALTIDTSQNSVFAGSIKTANPSGGTAQAFKHGSYVAGAPAATGYTQVEINGTAYKLLTAT